MATLNQIALPPQIGTELKIPLGHLGDAGGGGYAKAPLSFINESVSFTSSVGLNVSNRTVPANRWWLVQSMRLNSAETAKYYEFYADDGSTSHKSWHDPTQLTLPTTASDPVGWEAGNLGILLPPGWRLGIKIDAGAGSLTTNWQYCAFEIAFDK